MFCVFRSRSSFVSDIKFQRQYCLLSLSGSHFHSSLTFSSLRFVDLKLPLALTSTLRVLSCVRSTHLLKWMLVFFLLYFTKNKHHLLWSSCYCIISVSIEETHLLHFATFNYISSYSIGILLGYIISNNIEIKKVGHIELFFQIAFDWTCFL